MRLTEVIDKVAEAITAIEPEETASRHDRFTRIERATEGGPKDRTFFVVVEQTPQRAQSQAQGIHSARSRDVRLVLGVYYQTGAGANWHRRMASDADLILDALYELPAIHAQIHTLEVSGSAPVEVGEGGRMVGWDLEIEYDRRDA